MLNDYFSSVFTVDNGFIDTASLPHKVGTVVPPIFFTPSLVTKYINKLKTNGSPGPDGIFLRSSIRSPSILFPSRCRKYLTSHYRLAISLPCGNSLPSPLSLRKAPQVTPLTIGPYPLHVLHANSSKQVSKITY